MFLVVAFKLTVVKNLKYAITVQVVSWYQLYGEGL